MSAGWDLREGPDGFTIWRADMSRVIVRLPRPDTLDELAEARAVATKIAAAPDLLEALLTKRDYVADASSGALTYKDSGEGFIAMAKEDLVRIDAAIAKARGQ